jgi:uncharacterized protein Usg
MDLAGRNRGVDRGDLELQLQGWRLTTAEVLYYMPDHPKLIQTFTWQTLDLAPSYPRISKFLDFWKREIEAAIHSVRIGASEELAPARISAGRDFVWN